MRLPTCLAAALAALLAAASLSAQSLDDAGPFTAGWRDVQALDTDFGEGRVPARVYYPAQAPGRDAPPDPSGGPFPLTGFLHGWLGSASAYDQLCLHLASWGFVVVSVDTWQGIFVDNTDYAEDMRALLHWAEGASSDPASFLFQMVGDQDWAACGHSMGGGTLPVLVGMEPRIRLILGMEAADNTNPLADPGIQAYTGTAVFIAGDADWIVPPNVVRDWFELSTAARRSLFYTVQGMGHNGPTDFPGNGDPLPGSEQNRIHRKLAAGWLLSEILGQEDVLAEVLGEGMDAEPATLESRCYDPPFWARVSVLAPAELVVGIAGRPGDRARTGWSWATASRTTPFGLLELDLSLATAVADQPLSFSGLLESRIPVQPAWAGRTLYFQGLVDQAGSGSFSRRVDLVLP